MIFSLFWAIFKRQKLDLQFRNVYSKGIANYQKDEKVKTTNEPN